MKYLLLIFISVNLSATVFERRFYTTVAPMSVASDTYTPAVDEVIYLKEFGVDAGERHSTHVQIVWDGTILLATEGDAMQDTATVITGDGIKTIQIIATNDNVSSHIMGGFYLGEQKR